MWKICCAKSFYIFNDVALMSKKMYLSLSDNIEAAACEITLFKKYKLITLICTLQCSCVIAIQFQSRELLSAKSISSFIVRVCGGGSLCVCVFVDLVLLEYTAAVGCILYC
jgi:hypothetical protein